MSAIIQQYVASYVKTKGIRHHQLKVLYFIHHNNLSREAKQKKKRGFIVM